MQHWEAILFPAAALLYTIAIGGEQWRKGLNGWIFVVFAVAWILDASATIFVCVIKPNAWTWSFHVFMGCLALGIMTTHFVWAISALRAQGGALLRFHYFAPWAWGVWMVSFISGIPR